MGVFELRRRAIISGVKPETDCGRVAIIRRTGESVAVEADVFADGHDAVSCLLLYKREGAAAWEEIRMAPLPNDRWKAEFPVGAPGRYVYTIEAWVDSFRTWRRDFSKRVEAGQDVSVDLLIGARLLEEAAGRAEAPDRERLHAWADALRGESEQRPQLALDEEIAAAALRYPDRRLATRYEKELPVIVDRPKARFSAWYEFFPRSCSPEPGRHGTFKDAEARLEYAASMGFDVVYLPPIHPIGTSFRKGRNNVTVAESGDVGSPWAIGSEKGGHRAIDPELGSMADFQRFLSKAAELGLEVAIDIAFQCSPDHPYVRAHPAWFRRRPDGTIQYAENPPKKYQDIYPLEFEGEDWHALWEELTDVVRFWIGKGIRIFRVDNPHTKAFPFWERLIGEVKRDYPDTIFLAEAFTRPKVMYRLAKLGFTQSYTYFAWRNTKHELTEYFTELTKSEVREFFRPNLWPNTPDILPEYLQFGGRPAFIARLVLAATLGASYGIYGPAFELAENRALRPGSEEYLESEKYQLRHWDIDNPWSLRELIARVNRARRENPALQSDWSLRFHDIDNEKLLCYSKTTQDLSNTILVVVNLDPNHTHAGWVNLDLAALGVDGEHPYQVHELLGDSRYLWTGARNYVELNPQVAPAHVFRIRRKIRTERDFDYFL
ncbi:MAG: alpha-1,4-glucan--maltose-1-phosphate maltosyltransferase [Acidobacteria bacterium]|nr:alpha-1,4-glucan--maltose-1-phosphate maltosyltransferase [Acidobacteriota bacterium]